MASSQRVMITGGNGFIGYGVLVGLLKAGVRASPSKSLERLFLLFFVST